MSPHAPGRRGEEKIIKIRLFRLCFFESSLPDLLPELSAVLGRAHVDEEVAEDGDLEVQLNYHLGKKNKVKSLHEYCSLN